MTYDDEDDDMSNDDDDDDDDDEDDDNGSGVQKKCVRMCTIGSGDDGRWRSPQTVCGDLLSSLRLIPSTELPAPSLLPPNV